MTIKNNIDDFDLAFAYEAMARASAANKNKESFEKYYKLANKAGESIKKEGDKNYFFKDLEAGEWFSYK